LPLLDRTRSFSSTTSIPTLLLPPRKKKAQEASERKEEERIQWREQTKELDANKCVFIDES
jgi:hypothetical protein